MLTLIFGVPSRREPGANPTERERRADCGDLAISRRKPLQTIVRYDTFVVKALEMRCRGTQDRWFCLFLVDFGYRWLRSNK